jgi:hypothetical protein
VGYIIVLDTTFRNYRVIVLSQYFKLCTARWPARYKCYKCVLVLIELYYSRRACAVVSKWCMVKKYKMRN